MATLSRSVQPVEMEMSPASSTEAAVESQQQTDTNSESFASTTKRLISHSTLVLALFFAIIFSTIYMEYDLMPGFMVLLDASSEFLPILMVVRYPNLQQFGLRRLTSVKLN